MTTQELDMDIDVPYCDDDDCCDPAERDRVRERLALGDGDVADRFGHCGRCLRDVRRYDTHSLHCPADRRNRHAA